MRKKKDPGPDPYPGGSKIYGSGAGTLIFRYNEESHSELGPVTSRVVSRSSLGSFPFHRSDFFEYIAHHRNRVLFFDCYVDVMTFLNLN
jgi:hypothetical protein